MQEELHQLAERADKIAADIDQLERDALTLSMRVRTPIGVGAASYILSQWAATLRGEQ